MSETGFYDGDYHFKGSMDADGRIYDERHGFMGYVKDGTVYDNCGIPQGRITDSGMVVDNCNSEVGQGYGTGFSSPGTRRNVGFASGDMTGSGNGSDYGAFHLLDRRQRHRYDPGQYDWVADPDGRKDDDSGGGYDDDGDDEEDYGRSNDDDYGGFSSRRPARRRAGRNGASVGSGGEMSADDVEAGCCGCGCIVGIVIVLLWMFG